MLIPTIAGFIQILNKGLYIFKFLVMLDLMFLIFCNRYNLMDLISQLVIKFIFLRYLNLLKARKKYENFFLLKMFH